MVKINNKNYYSKEMNEKYMSASQFKSFLKCPACAMAELNGEWKQEKTTALLIGSYIDSYYEGTLAEFKKENIEELFTKTSIKKYEKSGKEEDLELKSEFKKADEIIARLEKDEMFSKYMSGKKQVIMTGEIEGIPVKIKMDSFHKDKCIVDLKVMKDMQYVWVNGQKLPFVEAWGYDIQLAIYQEIVRQNTGKQLPVFICVATKETVTNYDILNVDQERLDYVMESIIKPNIANFSSQKSEKIGHFRCEKCEYCISTKKLTKIHHYKDVEI